MEQVEQLGQQVIRIVPRAAPRVRCAPRVQAGDFVPRLGTQLLVLQPTPLCNIDCEYCYLPGRDDRSRMSLATVRAAARRLREDGLAGAELTVVWHAGEPLVLPPAFYEAAFAAVSQELGPATHVSHAVQTNATLIDDAWCSLFLGHAVAVGVSVDGPAALHDRHRRTRSGAGTHARVQRGINRLRVHGVPFHAIAVVTADTLAQPDAFFAWFEAQGIHELGCNFDEAEGVHGSSSLQGHDAAHAEFVERLLQWSGRSGVAVREFAAASALVAQALPSWQWRGESFPANTQVMPLAMVTVRHEGRWGTFSPELAGQHWPNYDDFLLGNVHAAGYLNALQGEAFARLWADVLDGVRACAAGCAHYEHCGGGAPVNKLYEHGHLCATETLYCRSMVKRPFDAVLRQAELQQQGRAA
jgi:uncharacterized protein